MFKKIKIKSTQSQIRILIILFFLIITLQIQGGEQGKESSLVIRHWSHKQGIIHHQINTLIQTSDNYIWMGTPAGLVRFDGLTMKEFNKWNTPDLTSSRIITLFEDRGNTLWVGSDGGGLFAYRNCSWTKFSRAEGLYNNHVRSIAEDWQGRIWVGTEYGLHRFDSGGVKRFSVKEGLLDNIITALCTDSLGNVWAGTLQGGLAKFKNDAIQVYGYKEGLINQSVVSLAAGRDRVWIGTMQGLFFIRYGEETVRYVENTAYTPITSIVITKSDKVWVGSMADGVKLLDKHGLKDISLLSDFNIRSILIDSDSTLWAGTNQSGLIQLVKLPISIVPGTQKLKPNSVLKDSRGFLWAGTEAHGLYRIKAGIPIKHYDISSGLAGNCVKALMEDHSHRVWIGDQENGISIISSDKITVIDNLNGTCVTALLSTPDGTVWIGTEKGLYFFRNSSLSFIPPLSGEYVRSLYYDGKILYVGTRNAVFKQTGMARFEKLPSMNNEAVFDVLSICISKDNTLWFGTNGNGLSEWDGDTLRTYTIHDGLPDNFINSITKDQTGRFWITCKKGIFSLHPDSLKKHFSNLTASMFTNADSVGDISIQSIGSPAAVFADSNFMAATSYGVVSLNTYLALKGSSKPLARIESLKADGKLVRLNQNIYLPFSTHQLEFIFTGFDFKYPDRLHFQYQLDGYEKKWHILVPDQLRRAEYRNLPAGKYKFRVLAINNNGVYGDDVSLSFVILKPFFQQPLFYLMLFCIVIFGLIFLFGLKKRKKIIKKLNKYKTTYIDPQRVIQIQSQLNKLMEEEVFIDPDLTLKNLAKMLKVHPNYLSRVINEQYGMSFNDFINKHRILKAMKMLADPAERDKSILDIMYATGFYSKSVFNTAFKKFAQITPSQYRKKQSH